MDDLYPLRIYLYDKDGRYGEPIQINSEAQLYGPGTRMILKIHADQGLKVIITDPADNCVFHAEGKLIIYPPD